MVIKKKGKNNSRVLNNYSFLNSSSTAKINKKKCPCCSKYFETHRQIAQQCEICFDITMKIFHFKCGCTLSVCKNCYNKIIVTRRCPGCRKNILYA